MCLCWFVRSCWFVVYLLLVGCCCFCKFDRVDVLLLLWMLLIVLHMCICSGVGFILVVKLHSWLFVAVD